MAGKWSTSTSLMELLNDLVKYPSVTGSEAEIEVANYIAEQLRSLSYFQKNKDHVRLHPTGDGRYVVTALAKKSEECRKTIILVSHFDVVDIQDYGSWKDQAFQVEELTRMFYGNQADMPLDVQQDLEKGNWLFGRGMMDMKCGLAVQMSMLEKAAEGEFEGNLLLLAVPDEEVNSVGMRAAVPVLLDLAKQYGLDYQVVLNSEPMFTRYPGDQHQYIYTGSIGKVLPGFLCYGKETHVGEPLSGLNANFMASQITCEMELNTDFCEDVEGEVTPPPTNLIQRDLKEEYSVQIPHRAVTLFNLFLYEKSIDQVLASLRQTADKAARRVEQMYAVQAQRFAALEESEPGSIQVRVLSFEELTTYAIQKYGQERVEELQRKVLEARGDKDDRDITIDLVDQISILCKELSPMVVVFFAPPFYPAVSSRKHPMIQRVVADMIHYAQDTHDITLKKQNYFGGISDLSYVGLAFPAAALQPYVVNMPLWDNGYSLPLEALEAFDVPVLNVGPVGRDAHKWTERLDADYAFEILPDLLETTIKRILAG